MHLKINKEIFFQIFFTVHDGVQGGWWNFYILWNHDYELNEVNSELQVWKKLRGGGMRQKPISTNFGVSRTWLTYHYHAATSVRIVLRWIWCFYPSPYPPLPPSPYPLFPFRSTKTSERMKVNERSISSLRARCDFDNFGSKILNCFILSTRSWNYFKKY